MQLFMLCLDPCQDVITSIGRHTSVSRINVAPASANMPFQG